MAFRRGDSYFFYGTYNGNYWSIQFPPVAGKYPSFSEGTVYAKYAYTSGSSAPYEIKLNSGTFYKAAGPMVAAKGTPTSVRYHRALGLVDHSTGSWLNLRVEEFLVKHNDGSITPAGFIAPPPDSVALTASEAFAALASESIILEKDADSLIVVLSVAGDRVPALAAGLQPLVVQFKAKTLEENPAEKAFPPLTFASNQTFILKDLHLSLAIKDFANGKSISIAPEIIAAKQEVAVSLGHIYKMDEAGAARKASGRVAKVAAPKSLALQAFPNPFNPSTNIAFELPQAGRATLRVYNIRGQVVRELLDGFQDSGMHRVTWDGRDNWGRAVASGLYFARLQVVRGNGGKKFVAQQKLLLTK